MSIEVNPALLHGGARSATGPTGPARATGPAASPGHDRAGGPAGASFADALKEASAAHAPLRFSKHALQRIERRGIPLDGATLGRLKEGVSRIQGKGARDSLVLVDGTAFVVSVNSRTVITAVGPEHMREHVFTNIDSAAIA